MEENWEPFEVVEKDEEMSLRLHGTKDKREIVKAGDVSKISKALGRGWNIEISYTYIDGDINIGVGSFVLGEDGRKVISSAVRIVHSTVKGIANFSNSRFEGEMDFTGTSFKAPADFSYACLKSAEFYMTRFEKGAKFIQTRIKGIGPNETNFCMAQFTKSEADFTGAWFDDAYFKGATFERVNFTAATFKAVALFWDATFGDAVFVQARFKKDASFARATFKRLANFRGAEFRKPGSFTDVKICENTVGRGLWKYILRPLFWWSWPVVWFFTIGKVDLRETSITDIYKINTSTVIDTSTNSRLKRYIDDEQWIESWRINPTGRWWREPVFRLWELTSHCGRSIGLWVFWSALFAVVFAFIYQAFGSGSITFSVDMAGKQPDLRAYLYYSVVTFTTLGFGDIIPKTNWARFAVGSEVILGYVMLGGLISIFANKFARRS